VALALESRRFGDYISWPMEALAAVLVAVSWGCWGVTAFRTTIGAARWC